MPAFFLTINDIDRTSYLGNSSQQMIQFSNILGARGTARFTLFLPLGFSDPAFTPLPGIGQEIGLFDPTGIRIWSGTIDRLTTTVPGGSSLLTLDVICASLEQICDRRMTNVDVFGSGGLGGGGTVTAGSIISALLVKYSLIISENLTIGNIQPGVSFSSYVCNYQTLSSVFDDLATQSDYIWYIDPASWSFNFVPRSTTPAPFNISDTAADLLERPIQDANAGMGMSAGGLARQFSDNYTRQDYRNRQWVRLSYAAFSPRVEIFVSSGIPGQIFTLTRGVGQMGSVTITQTTAASALLSFGPGPGTANPNPGDTVTVGGVTYTFVSALDNTVPNQVLATGGLFILWRAINGQVSDTGGTVFRGQVYSTPTVANPAVVATAPFSVTFSGTSYNVIQVNSQSAGEAGNGAAIATTGSVLSWHDTVANGFGVITSLGGGSNSVSPQTSANIQQLTVDPVTGIAVSTGADYYYVYGFTTIQPDAAYAGPPAGYLITVSYYPIGADVIGVENTAQIAARAAAENNTFTGIYEFLTDDSKNINPDLVLSEAQGLLDAYDSLPEMVYLEIRKPGLLVGQTVQVTIANPPINGTFLINEIQGYNEPGDQYPRYQLELISTSRIGTWLQLWQLLARVGSGGAGVGGGSGSGGGLAVSSTPPAGGAGLGNIIREIPIGAYNGVNTVFTLSSTPTPPWAVWLFVNGIAQSPYPIPNSQSPVVTVCDYTLSGNVVTFTEPPLATDQVWILYFGSTGNSGIPDARQFSGGTDEVNWGHNSLYAVTSDVSAGVWLKLTSTSHGNPIIYGQNSTSGPAQNVLYLLKITGSSGAWNIDYAHEYSTNVPQDVPFTTSLANDTWYYVGFSRNAAAKSVTLYVSDGISILQTLSGTYANAPAGGTDSANALTVGNIVGGADGSGNGPFIGTIQQYYVWAACLTSLAHLAAAQGAPQGTGLLLGCKGGNTPEVDISGNGGSGTVTGTTLVNGHV